MKFNTDYKSRFRILKGGKISLVVSALVVSCSLVEPVYALQVTGAETTKQSADTTAENLEVTSTGSITIVDDDANYAGLYGTGDIYSGITVSNEGSISLTRTAGTTVIRGININGYNDGDIINTGSGTIDINSSNGSNARGIDLDSNSGSITLDGGTISVISAGDATGLNISGDHTGDITNSSTLSATVNTVDFNDNAIAIKITGNMTNASILNSGTIYSYGNKNQTYGIFVGGTVTDITITNNGTIEVEGTTTSEAYGIFLDGGVDGTTTITNTSTGSMTVTSLDSNARGIYINGDSSANEILNQNTMNVTSGDEGHGIYINGIFNGDITNSATIQVSEGNTGTQLSGILVSDTFYGDILNDTFMQIQGTAADTYGIYVSNSAVGSSITNSGTIISHSENSKAYGISVEDNYGAITNNSLINVYSKNDYSIGLYADYSSGTITNTGTIISKSYSTSENTGGIWVETNEGDIVNDSTIDVYSKDTQALGIVAKDGSGTITNNANDTITVETINDIAKGIESYDSDITNSGTITAYKDGVLDKDALSVETFLADVTNTYSGTLNGNIYMYAGTLTNEGTISLPHNANGGNPFTGGDSAYIPTFTNEATGTLTIGLQTDGSTTTHSQLLTIDSTFEDGSTINVDVTSASTNVGNIAGERLDDIVTAINSLTVNGTINITDNSALLDFEIIDDADSLQDDTIDLQVVQGQTIEEAVETESGAYTGNTRTGGGATPAVAAARVLDRLNDGNHTAMNSVFNALNALSTNEAVAQAVESTTPQNTGASVGAASQISGGITGIVEQRQNVTLGGGLNSGDEMFTSKNVWFKPFGSIGKQNDKDGLNGFDLNAFGIGIGVDGEYETNQTLGFAFFYTSANVDVNNVSQESDLDVFTTLLYGNMPVIDDKTTFMYQLGYAWQKTNGERDVFTGDTAKSDYTSKTASLDLKLAQTFKVDDKFTIQPMVEGTYRYFKSPSYSENEAGALNLDVDSFASTELIVGGGVIGYYKLDNESKLVGNVNVGYDLHDKNQSVTAAYQGGSGVSYSTDGIDNGRWNYDLGIGYERDIDDLSNINLSFNRTSEGSDFNNNTLSAKYVLKF